MTRNISWVKLDIRKSYLSGRQHVISDVSYLGDWRRARGNLRRAREV